MHWLIFAIPVLLAFGWRLSFDAGRSHQRKLMWDVSTAFIIDLPDNKRLMLAESEIDAMFLQSKRDDPYVDDFAWRVRHDWAHHDPHKLFAITGITA